MFVSHAFSSLNSAVNPIIYGVVNETFRKALCLIFPWLERFLMTKKSKSQLATGRSRPANTAGQPQAGGIYDLNLPVNSFAISQQNRQNKSNLSGT